MDGRLETAREETEQKKLLRDKTLKPSYKSVMHNKKRPLFLEYDRIQTQIKNESKTYNVK